MLLAVARPTGVDLLDVGFLCSVIQFYVLLSHYLFLYLDLYVLGDDAWIS